MILYLFIFQEKRSVSVEIKWKGGNKGSKARVNITMGDSKYEPALCRGLHSCCRRASVQTGVNRGMNVNFIYTRV